ncbi:MAG: hypothetical protein MZU84_07450 [Sphingobacterium sp.]|nr:hypothetical protein [Sphingobacterium sp.]
MKFDIFVLPFMTGLLFLLALFIYRAAFWIYLLPSEDKKLIRKGLFNNKKLIGYMGSIYGKPAAQENFKVNPLLGYMHMSLAFGWFCLIAFEILNHACIFQAK